MTEKEKIALLIQKLRNMSVANGCTEAEANVAMNQLDKLMKEYNLTLTESEMINAEYTRLDINCNGEQPIHFVMRAIADYTETQSWYTNHGKTYTYSFLGTKQDVLNADYLWLLCNVAIEHEVKNFKKHTGGEVKGFTRGIAHRLSERFYEMKKANEKEQPQEYGIVLKTKKNMIKQGLEELGLNLRATKNHDRLNRDSYNQGYEAGDKIRIHKGVSDQPTDGLKRLT